jgi:hypothetical protein
MECKPELIPNDCRQEVHGDAPSSHVPRFPENLDSTPDQFNDSSPENLDSTPDQFNNSSSEHLDSTPDQFNDSSPESLDSTPTMCQWTIARTSRFPVRLVCSAGLFYLLLFLGCFVWYPRSTGLWPHLALCRNEVVVCDLAPSVRLSYACFIISQDVKARQKAQDVEDRVQEVRERRKPEEVKRRTEEMWTRARWPAWQRDETYVCRRDGEIYATATYQAFVPVHADCICLRRYCGWPGPDHRWKAVRYSFPSPSGGLVKVVVMSHDS